MVLEDAIRLCAENNEDFWFQALWAATNGGEVIISPDHVVIARRENATTMFIWLALGTGYLPKLCAFTPPEIETVKWWRELPLAKGSKVVQIPFQRLKRLCHDERTKSAPAASGHPAPCFGNDTG